MADEQLCIVCQKRKALKGVSFCNYCGAPDKITLYCSGCDNVQELNEYALDNIRKLFVAIYGKLPNLPMSVKTGVIIRLENCDMCPAPKKTGIMIFHFAKKTKN